MRLESEFTVPVTLDQTWETLLDLERVAGCVPGALLQSSRKDGTYYWSINVPLDPVTAQYDGLIAIFEVDEDRRVATLEARARQTRGHGLASALIVNRLESQGESTRVRVQTNLDVAGCDPESSPRFIHDVAEHLMREFATRLEQEIMSGPSSVAYQVAAAGVGDSHTETHRAEWMRDLDPTVVDRALRRALPLMATALVGLLVALVYRRLRSIPAAKIHP